VREAVQVLDAADMDAYFAAASKKYERGKSSMFGLGKYLHRGYPALDALCFLVSYVRDNPGKGGIWSVFYASAAFFTTSAKAVIDEASGAALHARCSCASSGRCETRSARRTSNAKAINVCT
jgi:hypothetical protein